MAWISLLDYIYPQGSIYMSLNNVSPAELIGGTWTQIKGAVLAASGDNAFANSGNYGGNLKISIDQMPPHTHSEKVATRASGFGGLGKAVADIDANYTTAPDWSIVSAGGGARLFALPFCRLYVVSNSLNYYFKKVINNGLD